MSGKLYVVGLGPGGEQHITPAARAAVQSSDAVVGYGPYLDFVSPLLAGKEIVSSGMTREVERCRRALELAAEGKTVSLVSSGDAGIYGMAGLALELLAAEPAPVEVEVVPGVSAVQAAAARLGAPLMHDFAVVSLSDLLTPWETIVRRLEAAASADFVVALYNPRSRGRSGHLGEARRILLCHRSPSTPVGIVRNACRGGEEVTVCTLGDLPEEKVDMLSVVLVGNSTTFVDGRRRVVTPRGYTVRSEERGVRSEPLTPHPSPLTEQGRALFVGGTGSDVGKSVLAAGLCRVLRRRGYSVAPFKAQNMALNSAVTPEGGEIGRAQALQAAACALSPHTDMNPVLLKPNSETGSQVIVQGRPVGNMSVLEYHAYKGEAFARVEESFRRLAAAHDVVVMEGAGSIAEVNLKAHDIANLRAAAMARAPVVLVADIDRGGVFASIVGTLELLEPAERACVAGVVINKFRGDPSLLRPGIEMVEERAGVPVLGVVPWISLHLPEEDSVALARKGKGREGEVKIGVVRLPRLSNYTDFDPLEREPGVSLLYLDGAERIGEMDLVILPGTKNTLEDLSWLRERGIAEAVLDFHARGGLVAGICGGYQMLGRSVADPGKIESARGEEDGLGLLDARTVLRPCKQTHQVAGGLLPAAAEAGLADGEITGYEIHAGETTLGPEARPLLRLTRRSGAPAQIEDGAVSADGRVWGTYLHGFFDNDGVRRSVIDALRRRKGLQPVPAAPLPTLEAELDRLADHLEAHLDLGAILACLDLPRREAL